MLSWPSKNRNLRSESPRCDRLKTAIFRPFPDACTSRRRQQATFVRYWGLPSASASSWPWSQINFLLSIAGEGSASNPQLYFGLFAAAKPNPGTLNRRLLFFPPASKRITLHQGFQRGELRRSHQRLPIQQLDSHTFQAMFSFIKIF